MISIKKKKIKIVLLVSLIIFAIVFSIHIVFKEKDMKVVYDALIGEKNERQIVEAIYVNGMIPIYDMENDIYYYPVNLEESKNEINLEIKTSKLSITRVQNKATFFQEIKLDKDIKYDEIIEIEIESLLYKNKLIKLKLTNMPIVSLNYDESKISREYTESDFLIVDPNYKNNNSKSQIYEKSKIRYRGSSSMGYLKKSFRVKLEKSENLLGMNENKVWILDAIASEKSDLRTKISSDIWNEINKDLDKDKYTSLNTRYIEMYINGKYKGLYVLKEVMDENTLNLDKNDGILVKGINSVFPNFNNYQEINSEGYNPFELKYPSDEQKYPKTWRIFLDRIKEYYEGRTDYNNINKTFYVENLINQRIFLLILNANDNYEFRNVYYSIKDNNENTKVLITPWDLDLTFGINWDDNYGAKKQYEEVEIINEPFGIKDDETFKQKLKERWKHLSETVLSKKTVYEMIDETYGYLIKANALERENNKNYNADILKEKEELKEWYNKRFDVINQYINEL